MTKHPWDMNLITLVKVSMLHENFKEQVNLKFTGKSLKFLFIEA